MLTWGAFHIVGGSPGSRAELQRKQQELAAKVQAKIDQIGVDSDGHGWKAKAYLYCVDVNCPQTGWMVPLIPNFIISQGYRVIARLIPDTERKRYDIAITNDASSKEMLAAQHGTIRSDGRGQDPYLIHSVNGVEYRTKISTLRGDFRNPNGSTGNKLRLWEKSDFKPRPDDIFQERLYAIQWWMRPKLKGKGDDYEFRAVTAEDQGITGNTTRSCATPSCAAATDAACEGLNLQTLGTLINVNLPWNPSRLEQRLGRIKHFGQARRTVDMLNLVYHDTQDEQVYQVLSRRLRDKFDIFGGLPDTIEDDWIESAERLEAMMDTYIHLRQQSRDVFELRYKETIDPDQNR